MAGAVPPGVESGTAGGGVVGVTTDDVVGVLMVGTGLSFDSILGRTSARHSSRLFETNISYYIEKSSIYF